MYPFSGANSCPYAAIVTAKLERSTLSFRASGFAPRADDFALAPDSVVEETIDFSGLGEFINLPFRTYSSGMQVRLAFSIATAITPEILIMDEWLSAGDKDFSEKSHKRLLKLVDNTNILILASHSKELISNVCNRVIWLDKGSVKMDGKTEDVINKYF